MVDVRQRCACLNVRSNRDEQFDACAEVEDIVANNGSFYLTGAALFYLVSIGAILSTMVVIRTGISSTGRSLEITEVSDVSTYTLTSGSSTTIRDLIATIRRSAAPARSCEVTNRMPRPWLHGTRSLLAASGGTAHAAVHCIFFNYWPDYFQKISR